MHIKKGLNIQCRDLARLAALRFGTAIALTAAAVATALAGQQSTPLAHIVSGPWTFAGAPSMPTIRPSLIILDGGDEAARVWLSYDAQDLRVFYKVVDSSPLKNSGDNSRMYFKTGDSCDLQLSVPRAPAHAGALPGDVRFEFVPTQAGPKAVAIRYKLLPGWPLEEQSDTVVNDWMYTSPTGQFTVDRVELVPDIKITTQLTSDGYTLCAKIPWADIIGKGKAAPTTDSEIDGDAGVLYSDPDGQTTVERVYWSNKDTAIVADVPTEAKITPQNWGTFFFDGPGK